MGRKLSKRESLPKSNQSYSIILQGKIDSFCESSGYSGGKVYKSNYPSIDKRQALALCIPEIHHSGQGVQYAAQEYVALLQQYQIQISMAAQGKPEENGYAERLMRIMKEENVVLSGYSDFADVYEQIDASWKMCTIQSESILLSGI